jgi:centractin
MAGAVDGDLFIGQRAQSLRGLLKLHYPLQHGMVTDWQDMERLWQHIYMDALQVSPEEHPVLLTEAALNPRKHRDQAAEIFFETFNVPALFVSIQAVLALYASGRTTGIVLDSGDGVTHAVPVYEGFAISSAIRRNDLAGRDVTEHLSLLLRKEQGFRTTTSAEMEVVREVKEQACFVALEPKREEREWLATRQGDQYKLPDGRILDLALERFRAPEILFSPELVGSEAEGIPALLVSSINKVDLDLRGDLYQNIVLSGGTTTTRGFGERLLREVRSRVQDGATVKIYAPAERRYSTWMGGSILAGLSTFRRMWVSNEEYRDNPEVIHTKCL